MAPIIQWDLTNLYNNNGNGLADPIWGNFQSYYNTTGTQGNASKYWTAGLAADRLTSEFLSGNNNINRINQLFASINNNIKQFIVVIDPSGGRNNLLLLYPITSDFSNQQFETKPANMSQPLQQSSIISVSNWPPSDNSNNLVLTNDTISESFSPGDIVGLLSTSGITSDDFVYNISGTSTNFLISERTLVLASTLSTGSYPVTITSSLNSNCNPNHNHGQSIPPDSTPYTVSNTFTITVTGEPSITGIYLSQNTITTNQPIGTLIGILSSSSTGFNNPVYTYTIVGGDVSKFQISGNKLQSNDVFYSEFLLTHSYSIDIESTTTQGSTTSNFISTFVIFIEEPPTPPPIPGRVPTGILPIQKCNSRFAKCNINKKSIYNSGSVTIQGSTLAQRVSTIARTQRKNRVVFQNVSLNGYGQKSGSPYGYGSSPKNTF